VVRARREPRRPYVVGPAGTARRRCPRPGRSDEQQRVLKTRSKTLLEFDDTGRSSKITLSTQGGHKLELDGGRQTVTLTI